MYRYRLLEDPKLMARIQNLATAPEPKVIDAKNKR